MHEGRIILPDNYWQKFFYGFVVGKADAVDKSIQIDDLCLFSWTANKNRLPIDFSPAKDLFVFNENDVILVRDKKIMRPFGKRVLISRDNTEKKVGNIVFHELSQSKLSSLYGVVKTLGTKNGVIESNLKVGDYVRIEKWDLSIYEIEVDGKYCLSVPEKLISCVIENATSFVSI